MLLLTGGVTSYILLHERRQAPRDLAGFLVFDLEGDVLRDEAVSLEISPDEVGGIDLKSSAGNLAFRRKDDGSWEMARGLKDRASREAVKVLLDFVAQAKILDTLDREEVRRGQVKESELGLDDSGAVEITYRKPGGGRLVEFKVGRTAPLGKAMYLQFNDVKTRQDIYLVNPDLREFLSQPEDQFRDRSLSKYPAERIRKFSVKRGEGEIELSRASTSEVEGAPWVISRPLPNARADQAVVKDFLGLLTGAKVSRFSSAGPGAGQPMGQMLAEVTLWPDGAYDRKGVSLAFFADPDPASKEATCLDRERKVEFKVERELVEAIALAESPAPFRETKLGNLDPAKVATLEVELGEGDSVGLYRVGERWAVRPRGGSAFQVASGAAVEKLIKALNEAEILEFSSDALMDKTVYGLEPAAVTLTFVAGRNASLEQLAAATTENSRILRLGILPTGKVYANFAGEPFVYQVGPEVAGLIPRQLIRWRTLQLPGFERLNLRGLRQTLGSAPAVDLKAAANSFVWSAERGGENVTALLKQAAAEGIAARLGSLQVASWQGESDASLRALALPAVVLEAAYEVPGVGVGEVRVQQVRVEFAPMSGEARAPLYYGRHSAVPGIFLMDAQTVRELAGPLLAAP